MSRSQDTVIDDDEDTCPLCIEEFDLSDKNFRPCPCGYQICQFCFNSLKTTYEKSNCPNCRRPYDEKTIQYKIPSAEEFKLDQLNKNKKQQAAKRKEIEKREVDNSTRRNLAGVRVKQQNLVYVIGLVPTIKDENTLLQTLRGSDYFGQYGEIEKIVVSKAKPGAINQGIGVYVTYKRKEDAALCINTVDGSLNGERVLRAQFGTTKYCSAFLRGETCNNKNCSFLHETGEDGQSSSIQNEPFEKSKLSSISHIAPPPRTSVTPQPFATSQAMAREDSKDAISRKNSHDSSALPSTASWANPTTKVRQMSIAGSRATPSPEISQAQLASLKADPSKANANEISQPSADTTKPIPSIASTRSASPIAPLDDMQAMFEKIIRSVTDPNFKFVYDDSCLSQEDKEIVNSYPRLIDPYGGAKRRMVREREASERARTEAEAKSKLEAQAQAVAEDVVDEDNMANGSLALGGEPDDIPSNVSIRGGAIGRPLQATVSNQFRDLSLDGRSLTPQQQLGLGSLPQASGLSQPPSQNAALEMSDFERRPPQFSQAQYDQISNHQRNGSRYFNTDSKTTPSRFQGQQPSFYSSGVQGPPPGLQTAGTPSVSGGGMFAHGQNFTNPGFGSSKDPSTDLHMRGRSATGGGHDIAKRGGGEHLADPSIVQARVHQGGTSGQGLFGVNQVDENQFPPLPTRLDAPFPNFPSRVSSIHNLETSSFRPTTPKVPPGFEASYSHPPIGSRPTTPAPAQLTALQRSGSNIVVPLVPLLPSLNRKPISKPGTPKLEEEKKDIQAAKDIKHDLRADASTPSSPKKDGPGNISLGSPKPPTRAKNEVKTELEISSVPVAQQSDKIEQVVTIPAAAPVTKAAEATRPESKGKEKEVLQKPLKVDLPTSIPVRSPVPGETEKKDTPILDAAFVATPPAVSSVPSTPATTSTEFSKPAISRPRTLRVTTGMVQKATEPAPLSATTDRSATTSIAVQLQQRSRQPSIASFAQSPPSTPSLSQDVSRASSPHPSIVGSAPERTKTKAQLKKERKESKKKAETTEAETAAPTPPPAEEVGPIVARQKKQKKRVESNVVDDGPREAPPTPKDEKLPELPSTPVKSEPEPIIQPEKTKSKKQLKKEPKTASPTPPEPQEELPTTPDPPKPPYTLRDYYHDATMLDHDDLLTRLSTRTSHPNSILSSLVSSGDIDKITHPWFNPASFNSAAFKIPTDNRRGQDYLDAHGYVDDAFGYIYLPQKEKRALAAGNAVSVADTGERSGNLLRRALITPSGWVLRHLSQDEAERVLDLEEHRAIYAEDFGELGVMHGIGELELDDYSNLAGGLEELSRNGDKHGVCWVLEDGNQAMQFDDGEDEEDLEGDVSDGTDDLGVQAAERASWNGREGAVQKRENTLPPIRNRNVNLRAMTNEQLQKRVAESQKELEQAKREVEKFEKVWQKKGKEVERWRKGITV